MRAILLIIFSLCIFQSLQAKEFSGYYISLNNDTIECSFDVKVNMFRSKLVNQLSFRKGVKVISKEGKQTKFKPNQIKGFRIQGTSNGAEDYIPMKVKGKMWFVRLHQIGTIELYEFFYPHGYDWSCQSQFLVKYANKNPQQLSSFSWRKRLVEYMDENEWFKAVVKIKRYNYEDIPELVSMFNNMMEKQ